jgi:hypothetical protein
MAGIRNTAVPSGLVIPHSPVLGAIVSNTGLVTLPINWRSFVITTDLPTTVNAQTELAPTSFTTEHIRQYFARLTADYKVDECVEFQLVDPVSKDIIMVLRYLPVPGIFVIKPTDVNNYATYPGDISKLIINNYSKITTASSFVATDTSAWLSRAGTTTFATVVRSLTYLDHVRQEQINRRRKQYTEISLNQSRIANAALALAAEAGSDAVLFSRLGEINSMLDQFALQPRSVAASVETRDVGTSIMRGPLGYENNPVFNNATQTDPVDARATPTRGPTKSKGISTGSKLPSYGNVNNNYNYINLGQLRDNDIRSGEMTEFMKQLALNTIPIYLLQQNQSNGDVMGTLTHAGFEEAGISSDDFAFQHTMQEQHDQQQWQAQQNQYQQDFTSQQNALNRQEEEKLQEQTFEHQQEMQNKQFDFTSQQNQLDRQQKQQMQVASFEHDTQMSAQNFEQNKELNTQKFHESLITTGLGAGVNLATHVIDDATQIYNTQQEIKSKPVLMAQAANDRMYVAGATAQSMQLSTNA